MRIDCADDQTVEKNYKNVIFATIENCVNSQTRRTTHYTRPLATSLMRNLIQKPHFIFLIAIPIVLLIGRWTRNDMMDINVHDTYFIISYVDLEILISSIFGIFALGYWILNKTGVRLSKKLNLGHLIMTFALPISALIISQFHSSDITKYEFNKNLNLIIMIINLIAVFGQILFPINMIYGLIRKKKQTSG